MRLDEYAWSRNPRGLHNIGAFQRPDFSRYSTPQMGWAKLVSENVEHLPVCEQMVAANITPIIRVYLTPQQNFDPLSQQSFDLVSAYAAIGVKWFELYNEPNLPVEWPQGVQVDFRNSSLISMLVDRWMTWAEFVAGLGCYPGFISLADTPAPALATVHWVDTFFNYIATAHYQRFTNLLRNGAWYATHPYVRNHFYQEQGGPLTARPPEGVNSQEGGWHFEYPYDPICQSTDPGRSVIGGTAQTPDGDPVGLIATGQFMNERSAAIFGTQAVPVVGTEGGIDLPMNENDFVQPDTRYPPVTLFSNGEGSVAMFNWCATSAPPWFFGVCMWKEDEYYNHGGYALGALQRYAPIYKNVPAIDVLGGSVGTYIVQPFIPPAGPGPIHGEPTYHMVVLAPGLDPSWFFDTAFAYWSAFRPIVTPVTDFVNYIPYAYSLATTVIATPDTAEMMRQLISGPYPNILFDLIVAEGDVNSVAQILNDRVTRGAPFG